MRRRRCAPMVTAGPPEHALRQSDTSPECLLRPAMAENDVAGRTRDLRGQLDYGRDRQDTDGGPAGPPGQRSRLPAGCDSAGIRRTARARGRRSHVASARTAGHPHCRLSRSNCGRKAGDCAIGSDADRGRRFSASPPRARLGYLSGRCVLSVRRRQDAPGGKAAGTLGRSGTGGHGDLDPL